MALLEVCGVKKSFGALRALDGVGVTVETGTFHHDRMNWQYPAHGDRHLRTFDKFAKLRRLLHSKGH